MPKILSLVEGVDFYREGGRYVFTAAYHLKRGYCCNSGCRHCPYREGPEKNAPGLPRLRILGLPPPSEPAETPRPARPLVPASPELPESLEPPDPVEPSG